MNSYLLVTLFFAVFVLPVIAQIYGPCPPDRCAQNPPTVQDGVSEKEVLLMH